LLAAFGHRPPGSTHTKVIFSLLSPDFIMPDVSGTRKEGAPRHSRGLPRRQRCEAIP
jgi:hypothetical protein